ncbi:MAG: hypothetical protein SO434_03530 [Eubacteriales bacterium]|nr:hypothetical protein [Eubacteriales bacterium]
MVKQKQAEGKKPHKGLKVFLVLLILFVVCCLIAVPFALQTIPVKEFDTSLSDFYCNWMSHIPDDVLIKNLVIPGSHDSGTVTMPSIGCTQNRHIQDQVKAGIRYFDIRVAKQGDDLVIFHSILRGVRFEPIAQGLYDFIVANPSEFLILDFQYFENSQQMIHDTLQRIGLADLAVVNDTDLPDYDFVDGLTVGDMRGKVLIVWGADSNVDYAFRRNNNLCTVKNCVLTSPFYILLHGMQSQDVIDNILPLYYKRYKEWNKGLFVLQCQITFGPNLYQREASHKDNMTAYVNSIASDPEKLKYINIVMREYADDYMEKINSILRLNIAKGFVEESDTEYVQTTLPPQVATQ